MLNQIVDERIAIVEAEIEKLNADLKAKKADLKALNKAKIQAEKAAAEKKAEEEKSQILEAILQSGKTLEEVMELLK